jgi:hypothetical protein
MSLSDSQTSVNAANCVCRFAQTEQDTPATDEVQAAVYAAVSYVQVVSGNVPSWLWWIDINMAAQAEVSSNQPCGCQSAAAW